MQISIYADNSLPLPTDRLCDRLNWATTTLAFKPGTANFRVTVPSMDSSRGMERFFSAQLIEESSDSSLSCLATHVGYDNNYFFDANGCRVIVSFNGWSTLTDLPISNGLAYFVTAIVARELRFGELHDATTGCINDFWLDKREVDFSIRAAYLCSSCVEMVPKDNLNQLLLADIQALLNEVSSASRNHRDLLEVAAGEADADAETFDVFLCHNSKDKPAVRAINSILKGAGLKTWLDEEQLEPGMAWQIELEEQIEQVGSAVVCVGEGGMGLWQKPESRGFLEEFADRQCRVIPVLLPDAPSAPKLPVFLRQMTWIDLREDYEAGMARLISALKP